jgi:hypothetical protein
MFPPSRKRWLCIGAACWKGGESWGLPERAAREQDYLQALETLARHSTPQDEIDYLHRNIAWASNFQPLTEAEQSTLASLGKKLATRWGTHFGPFPEEGAGYRRSKNRNRDSGPGCRNGKAIPYEVTSLCQPKHPSSG